MNDTNAGAQFRVEGEPAFPLTESTENDHSTESPTEKTNTEQTQSQEGEPNSGAKEEAEKGKDDGEDKGFADHPRWKEREENWQTRFNDQEKRHVDEIGKLRTEFEAKFAPKPEVKAEGSDAPSEEPPSWFGGDKVQWGEYQKHIGNLITQAEEKGAKRALSEFDTRSSKEKQAVDDATKFFNETVASLESDKELNPQGMKIDRNKLLKTALDNDLVDSTGKWNYKAAFRMMKPAEVFQAKTALDEKKKIADASTSDTRAESKSDNVTTSTDFSKPGSRPW